MINPRLSAKDWTQPKVYRGALILGFVLAALGILLQRFDLALMGIPPLLVTSVAGHSRPKGRTIGHFEAPVPNTNAGLPLTTETNEKYHLALPGVDNVDAVQVRVYSPGHRPTTLVTKPGNLGLTFDSVRTGPHPTFTVQARGHGAFDLWQEQPWATVASETVGLPTNSPLGLMPAPARLRGLTGSRQSRRFGDGGDLRDIAPMRPGDSLRRVDWRATGRRSPELNQLYVRRTFSNAEGIAELVIDSRDDVGPDLETWRGSGDLRGDDLTSLDLARNAAASVAGALIATGDRVGLEDLAYQRRPVAAATGQRQLRRIQQALALSRPKGEPSKLLRPPRLPNDAVIYLFSTLLDDTPLTLASGWIDQGNVVIVIDTLPNVRTGRSANLAFAWRITQLERNLRLETLKAQGIPIVPWHSAGSVAPATEFAKVARAQAKTRGRR